MTNTPPSAQDAAIIHGMLADINQQLAQKTALLEALQRDIQELERERKFFKPMISAVRRMPVEVLGEIFEQSLDYEYFRHFRLSDLCMVSKSWREAAISTPKLWHTMTYPSLRPLSYEAASLRINRARGLPRTLRIEVAECAWPSGRNTCAGLAKCPLSKSTLGNILQHVPLDKVVISCPTPQCFRQLNSNVARHFGKGPPNPSSWNFIRSISLDWRRWTDEWENFGSEGFSFLPKSLVDLQIHLPPIAQCPEDLVVEVNMPPTLLQRLTSLDLSCDWSSNCAFKMLRHCVNLDIFTLRLQGANFEWNVPHNVFVEEVIAQGLTLPKVRTVQVTGATVIALENLKYLKMPTLSELSIAFGADGWMPEQPPDFLYSMGGTDGNILGSFLRGSPNSPSTLRSLCITNGHFQNDALFNALQHPSSVEHLTLRNAVFSNDTFAKLASRKAIPHLQSLQLLQVHTNPSHFSGLKPFVENGGIKLETTRCDSSACEICAN